MTPSCGTAPAGIAETAEHAWNELDFVILPPQLTASEAGPAWIDDRESVQERPGKWNVGIFGPLRAIEGH
jgi:hypothetical protein